VCVLTIVINGLSSAIIVAPVISIIHIMLVIIITLTVILIIKEEKMWITVLCYTE